MSLTEYQICLDTLIDNFITLGVERCLLSELDEVLCPITILSLSDADVVRMSQPPEEVMAARQEMEEELKVLQEAQRECNRWNMIARQ